MNHLIVCLLGAPCVAWNGSYLPIPRRRVRALLYRLVLEMQPVSREHLAFIFWENKPDAVAHRDLTHLVTHLRQALPEDAMLQSTADYFFVDPRRVWSDTSEFIRILRLHHARPSVKLLEEAAALVRGSLMDGFTLDGCAEYEEWLTIERSIWEQRHLSVLHALEREKVDPDDIALAIAAGHDARDVAP